MSSLAASPLIALTQRVTRIEATGEKRDSLDQKWRKFMAALNLSWIALPNDVDYSLTLARSLGVSGLILTGGENLGENPERDAMELALLDEAAREDWPVLGICRGFQLMLHWLGANLKATGPEIHRARRHDVLFTDGARREVNSFHNFGPDKLPKELAPLAVCPIDGLVEAAFGGNLLGLMWHPERENIPDRDDLLLIGRRLFVKSGGRSA
ncbi:glutamine amidotransferase [Alphaproteobacteria bacterium]|nr:glutamine amidotransferase [Alphaproteobacteria bacterium]